MKLSSREAQLLIAESTTCDPHPNALDRVLEHDWTFDPRGERITLALRRYHEQDQVLYGTWRRFREEPVLSHPGHTEYCTLCASTIPSPPFFTAENHTSLRWEICCACAAAMGIRSSSISRLLRVQPSRELSRFSLTRAFAALRRTLRRFFR